MAALALSSETDPRRRVILRHTCGHFWLREAKASVLTTSFMLAAIKDKHFFSSCLASYRCACKSTAHTSSIEMSLQSWRSHQFCKRVTWYLWLMARNCCKSDVVLFAGVSP